MTTVVCVDCGQADSKDRMLKAPRGFVHIFNKYCEKTWQARAEAAERRVAELEARLIDVDMAQISTANELEAIAASLGLTYDAWPGFAPILQDIEMRLSAQGWRTVTGDDLPEDHDEALVTVTNEDGYRFVDMAEFTVGGVWWQHVDTGWRELKRVTHWRPLPAPPID